MKSSRLSPGIPGAESSRGSLSSSHASGSVFQHTTRRRQNVVQPPALMTSFNSPQYQGLGLGLNAGYISTPLSTTSLSSPFSQSQPSYLPSPGGAMRGSSPMAQRLPTSYNIPYNPQEWGVVGGSPPQGGPVIYPQSNNGIRPPQPSSLSQPSDIDVLPSPPPPYSPPSQHQASQDPANQQSAESASHIPMPSQHRVPTGGITPGSVEVAAGHPQPATHVADANSSPSPFRRPPPPPHPGAPGSRSSSRNGTDRPYGPSNNNFPLPNLRPRQANVIFQQTSSEADRQPDHVPSVDSPSCAPSSKRAASTGAIHDGTSLMSVSQSNNRSPPRRSWGPGAPLPPPPPGPPPPSSPQIIGNNTSREPTRHISEPIPLSWNQLPPVLGFESENAPPTRADRLAEVSQDHPISNPKPLHLDTVNMPGSSSREVATSAYGHTDLAPASHRFASNGLFRSSAIRDNSTNGIRERRIESKYKRQQGSLDLGSVSTRNNPWKDVLDHVGSSYLGLPAANINGESSAARATPKPPPPSARSISSDDAPDSARSRTSSGLFSNQYSVSTPRQNPSPAALSRKGLANTPPFSPAGEPYSPTFAKEASYAVHPKALPTPPPHSAQDLEPYSNLVIKSTDDQLGGHLFHTPKTPVAVPAFPRRISTQQPSPLDSIIRQDADFAQEAVQRHREFIEKETYASSEAEALKLFAEFIISESHIRRVRYSRAYNSGSLNVQEVCRQLFELPAEPPPQSVENVNKSLMSLFRQSEDNSASIFPPRPESAWWNNYQPCLSPIASISMSNEDISSRGRPPSRWWESKTGSSSEGAERKIQRSKRESKYMGVPRELREAMQIAYNSSLQETKEENDLDPTEPPPVSYGPDEYPPEKVGWHDQSSESLPPPSKSCDLPSWTHKQDISRLITLPPPYPRHYPAVNNNHPDLITYRTTVRSISELSEIKATRHRHKAQAEDLHREHQEKIHEGRRQFKSNIQKQIMEGSITFAEAAEAEAVLAVEEKQLEKELMQSQFDSYQEIVLKPMHAILMDRVSKATECIDELSSKLDDAAQYGTPDQTQEEGDEKPELLEKLTQLKWLFEAREQLHREVYELLSESNEKYRTVVSLPYKQNRNEDKIRETDSFFVKDTMDRLVQFETDALSRFVSFMDVIEENVKRGVEMHLSTFWDIAPSLLELVQQIPDDLRGFQIQIPVREYEENPSYYRFPYQYLYSLLLHAEKSTYQFIESQTNLLCLLHEVKFGVMNANCKLMEAQRIRLGEPEDVIRREMTDYRAQEERDLTADLKDKVAMVEGQWTEALGSQIQAVRDHVKSWLTAEGGWEEMEQLEA